MDPRSTGLRRSTAFASDWAAAAPAITRCLELAYACLRGRGLACGSVLIDKSGATLAEGRNRAYEPGGGSDLLKATPIAHAEMNVLAATPTDSDLSACTLWSSQQPCSMCTAAAAFVGVGTVRYLAPDPWAGVAQHSRSRKGVDATAPGEPLRIIGAVADRRWVAAASTLFLLSIARAVGLEHPTIVRSSKRDPATTAMVRRLVETGATAELPASASDFLAPLWTRITTAGRHQMRE